MAQEQDAFETHIPPIAQRQAIPPAVGIHVGLAIVCFSAAYTGWQTSIVTMPQWGTMLLVAVSLLVAAFWRHPRMAQAYWVRLVLALGGLLALRLCYDPQLETIPRIGEELPPALLETYPSIALIGIAIALIAWRGYVGAGGQFELGTIPAARATWVATGLLTLLAVVAFLLLHGPHDLYLSETLRVVLAMAQGGSLVVVLLSIGGGPGVRRAPHIYIALTLIAAFARNMAFPME